jgi:ribosomal protein S18 acetylase RimI-like enzyme
MVTNSIQQGTPGAPISAKNIRSATLADVRELEPLIRFAYRGGKEKVSWTNEHKLVKGPRISEDELKEIIASSDKTILVAEEKAGNRSNLLGCILVEKQDDEAYIGMLAVDPDRQSAGVGKLLLQSAEMHATGIFDCETAKMWILAGRDELLAWYKRMGYEETGETEPFLPPESGVTALVEGLHFQVIKKELD